MRAQLFALSPLVAPQTKAPLAGFAFQEVGRPSVGSLGLSVCLHGIVLLGMALISLSGPREIPKPQAKRLDPTTILIGDRLYFVTRIPVFPRAVKAAASPAKEVRKPGPIRRVPPKAQVTEVRVEPPAPADPPPNDQPSLRPAPRTFVPPEVKKNFITDATLVQPLSPPDLIPKVTPLPSFRVWTAPLLPPKIPKPFVAPGRKNQSDLDPPVLLTPDLDLVHADPALSETKANLILPPTLPPIVETAPVKVTPPDAMGQSKIGDRINILSLSDRPVPPTDKLVVPPGNLAGKSGEESGTGLGASRGGPVDVAKADVPGAGASPASAASPPARARVITHPANGRFDAVVIQSSPGDQFPEAKDLLTGRPIYTVYISVGTTKDWAFYFCLPGEKGQVSGDTRVVHLDPVTPLQAPYPTRIVRPDVVITSYEKHVLVHGFVSADGRFEKLRVVKSVTADADHAIVTSLSEWEFRSATRDGVKVAVEFLLSIPVSGL